MACDRFEEAISALVDGEEPTIERRLVDAHVATCAGCAAFRAAAEDARRRLRVHEVASVTDVSRRVTRANAVADRAGSWRIPRVLLLVVAIEVVALSLRDMFAASGDGATVHSLRHLSAFTIAYGVLLLAVVARPARARTALPVAGVLALALAITAVADLVAGHIPFVNETLHLPEIVSVLLIWLLAVPGPRRRRRVEQEPHRASGRPFLAPIERDAG